MHTKKDSGHRHIAVAPLFLLLLIVSVSERHSELAGTIADVSSGIRIQKDGTVVHVQSATVQDLGDSLVLTEGLALVSGHARMHLKTPDADLIGLAGGFFAARHMATLTVAALTSPVLIRSDRGMVIVPVGMQWRGTPGDFVHLTAGVDAWIAPRTVTAFPAEFIERQWDSLKAVASVAEKNAPLPPMRLLEPLALNETMLRFPEAQKRAREDFTVAILGYVRFLLENVKDANALMVLQSEKANTALSEDAVLLRFAPALLARFPDRTSVAFALAEALNRFDDLSLLLSVHPSFRSLAWALPETGPTDEFRLLRLRAFPEADLLQDPASEIAFEKWQDAAASYVRAASDHDAASFAAHVLESLERMRAKDLSDRADRYTQALRVIIAGREDALPQNLQHRLERLSKTLSPVPAISLAEESSRPSAPEQKKPELNLTEQDIQSRAREILRAKGVLFTIKSVVSKVGPISALISNIVLPSRNGDRMFTFELNLETLRVRNVELDGQILPFSLSLDAFVTWATDQDERE
ncbi:MAG: hypothetical protein AAB489_06005 [Patescibacteria group bacterium]